MNEHGFSQNSQEPFFCVNKRSRECFISDQGPPDQIFIPIKQTEDDITAAMKKVNELAGTKGSDTGLAVPDLAADKQALETEEPLQVSSGLSLCV